MAFTGFHGPDFAFENLRPDGGELLDQLAAWHRAAVAAGRVPALYLRATWCPANTKLEATLADPRMHAALSQVAVATCDVDVWSDPLGAAGFKAGSVPAFFILEADGKSQGPTITGAAWGADVAENIAPPLGRFFDVARALRPPPPPPAPTVKPGLNLGAVIMLVLAAALLGLGVYLKVASEEADDKADADAERDQRIRKAVQESIQRSLHEQKK